MQLNITMEEDDTLTFKALDNNGEPVSVTIEYSEFRSSLRISTRDTEGSTVDYSDVDLSNGPELF